MKVKNIFKDIPKNLSKELFTKIISKNNCKIERIISKRHTTPKNKWYDQDKNEFVIILKGSAELLFFPNKKLKMKSGDYLNIPANIKHRVDKTSKKTIWLAVFY